ncbi:MAG: S1/P1 nuclease [Bacteroidetes bacterium]|nr:S1/P1 nuclease [Bacteroidota bacterium]
MKRILRFLALILPLTLVFHTAKAWWDVGHMAVAQIAYDELKPGAKKWADGLIATLTVNYPQTHNFVEAATWPDDLKGHGITAYSNWHYTNIPLNDNGVAIACNATPEIDVVWAIGQARSILGNPKSTDAEKGQFLAFLIHFVGDLHQPLHSTSMYTNALPGGDMGGNLFPLKDSIHTNLHKLWDDGCGYFDRFGKVDRAAGPEVWKDTIQAIAKAVTQAYPAKSIMGLDQLDPEFWALESHNDAVNFGYKGVQSVDGSRKIYLKPNDTPSALYLEVARKIVERQIASGGYRLAMILNALFDAKAGK